VPPVTRRGSASKEPANRVQDSPRGYATHRITSDGMNLLKQVMRLPLAHGLWSRFPVGPVDLKVLHGIYPYPHYAFGVYWAAFNARQLGIPRITVIEFGVAGGRGLVALERASAEIERALGVEIDVLGFDSGSGMPRPRDYRDLPYVWNEGFFPMDEDKLRAKLTSARLFLGEVGETIAEWLASGPRAPLGFISFDLDYYTSTKAAFSVFQQPSAGYLPRVICYFDDVASSNLSLMNEHVGELLAIKEFNAANPHCKIAKIEQLRVARPRFEDWQDRMYAFHDFEHPDYGKRVAPDNGAHVALPL